MISVVSASTADPPTSASMSEQYPRAGFAVMPENESDPPQFNPRISFEAGAAVRPSDAARSIISLITLRAAATVAVVPPVFCSVIPCSRFDFASGLSEPM